MNFGERLSQAVRASAPCCVGLDPHLGMLPQTLDRYTPETRVLAWSRGVIDAVVASGIKVLKPQAAFFEALGPVGVDTLHTIIRYAKEMGLLVILDAKRGDIGSTAEGYIQAFKGSGADAITLNPYLGPESLDPWKKCGGGAFVLLRTSNPGAIAWQGGPTPGTMAFQVAEWIRSANAEADIGPFGAVVGATLNRYEVQAWRELLPNAWFLLPGYGAQGARASDCRSAFRPDGLGGLVVSARDVLFPMKGVVETDWERGVHQRAMLFLHDIKTCTE